VHIYDARSKQSAGNGSKIAIDIFEARSTPRNLPSSHLPHFCCIEAAASLKELDTHTEGQARHSLQLCGNPIFEKVVQVVNSDEEARHDTDT